MAVVNNNGLVFACQEERDDDVGANITQATGDEDALHVSMGHVRCGLP